MRSLGIGNLRGAFNIRTEKIMVLNKENIMQLSLLIFIFSMPFGFKIFGRFAISNIGQIVSFLLLAPLILTELKKRYLSYNVCMITLMILASAFSALRYGISMHWGHIGFFSMISLYISYFVMCLSMNTSQLLLKVQDCFKVSAYVFLIPYIVMGYNGIVINKKAYLSYLFDDKSHAVIFFAFYAFISLGLISSSKKYVISILYFILSLTTTSRLGIIFIPFYLLAFYRENMAHVKVFWKKLVLLVVVGIVIGCGIWFVYQNAKYFSVFGRIGNSSGSTRSHLILIYYSLQIKFSNIINILFGTGPGSFSNILICSHMNLSEIMRDGGSYRAIINGVLPVHSSHFELLMDFSLIGFFVYIKFLWVVFQKLRKQKLIIDLLFFIAFMGAELFYSTFHEGLFYMILLYLYIRSLQINKEWK